MFRLLLVAGEDEFHKSDIALFRQAGYLTIRLSTGAEALAHLSQDPGCDIILCADTLDDMDAFAFIRRLRQTGAAFPPVVIIAGQAETPLLIVRMASTDPATGAPARAETSPAVITGLVALLTPDRLAAPSRRTASGACPSGG